MRFLRPFNESKDLDINSIVSKIKEEWSAQKVRDMIERERENWIDDDWEESEFDSNKEWYDEHNNGEAEEVVFDHLIGWFEKKFGKKLDDSRIEEIRKILKKEYDV